MSIILKGLPYALIAGEAAFAVLLLWSASHGLVSMSQGAYVAVIAIGILGLTAILVSAVLLLVGRFRGYWGTGYPHLLALGLLAMAVVKSVPEPTQLLVGLLAVAAGYAVMLVVPPSLQIALPAVAMLGPLVLAELAMLPAGIRAAIPAIFFGAMLQCWLAKRKKNR